MERLQVESPAFAPGAEMPPRHTADGPDRSPPVSWASGPPGTAGYALLLEDPDATTGSWVHWVVWNIPSTRLAEGMPPLPVLPDGTRQGRNSWHRHGYGGPCPPHGSHRYRLTVLALDRRLDINPEGGIEHLRRAMAGHILARGELATTYTRRRPEIRPRAGRATDPSG